MRKVMVLEDESSIRSFIVINLRRAGYEVVEAETGEEALDKLHENPDTLVALLDVMLPGIDGFEVCRRIRATNPRIGIIMLTARSQEMDKVTGLMNGADDYVTKPFSPVELTARANISGLITGWIHHIIYDPALVSEDNPDGILKEWWEPEYPQPNPEDPNAPAEESNEVDLGTPGLHVETLEGVLLPFDARQQGSTLRVTSDTLAARLHGTRQALEALREQGVEQIQFVTTLKTTTLSVEDLLAEGGSWFALEHDGLVSRQLSAAQAESLKCWMH